MNLLELFQTAAIATDPDKDDLLGLLMARIEAIVGSKPVVKVSRPRGLLLLLESEAGRISSEKWILELCQHLHRELIVPVVLIEGGEGRLFPEMFSLLPSRTAKASSAETFLAMGRITGAEAFCMVADNPPPLYGIDSATLHQAHADAAVRAQGGTAAISLLDRLAVSNPALFARIGLFDWYDLCQLKLTPTILDRMIETAGNWDKLRSWFADSTGLLYLNPTEVAELCRIISAACDFYSCALNRSRAMALSSLLCLEEQRAVWGVAQITGFHGPVIESILAERDWITVRHPVFA